MALYVLIGVVLASFVLAFFAARTWHWGHVIVAIGVVLSTVGFLILAAEVLRINQVYRSAIARKTTELEQLTARNAALRDGTEDQAIINQLRSEVEPAVAIPENAESILSLADLDHQILLATRARGRVWRKVAPAGVDAATGGVKVTIDPTDSGLKAETVVYVFEDGPSQLPAADGAPQGKQYIGEFRVATVAGQQATLVPVQSLDQFEQRRLAASRGPWIIYETMPQDRYDIFAGMSEEELRKLLPAKVVDEFLKHGKEAQSADDDARKLAVDADGKPLSPEQAGNAAKFIYQRRLIDFAGEFDELAQRRSAMEVSRAAVQQDIDRLKAAHASAQALSAALEKEIAQRKTDLAGVQKERQAIEKHLGLVRQQLANLRKMLEDTLKQNSELADRLAATEVGAVAAPTATTARAN